jgi:DNA repair exonuclease SbcCD ATPase subunit
MRCWGLNIIKTVKMENFRGYADKNNIVKFTPGINLVLGDNATGKSTIITAILFNLLHKKIDVAKFEDYRTLEPKDLKNFRSEVTITGVDGKEYTIEKSLSGNRLDIKIKCNGEELKKCGELELKRQKDAQRFILDKFGVREEVLEDILVQVQDPVKLLWPVREAMEVGKELSKLLRLEPLQNIYTNAKSVGKLLEDKGREWEKEVEKTKEQIKKLKLLRPEEYQKQKRKLEREKVKLEEESKQLESNITKFKNKKEEKEKILADLLSKSGMLKEKIGQINKIKEELKGQRKPTKTFEKLKIDKENLKATKNNLQNKLENVERAIGKLETEKEESAQQKIILQQKIDSLSNEYLQLTKQLKMLGIDIEIKTTQQARRLIKLKEDEYRKFGEEIGGLKNQMETEKQYANILSKAKAKCPVCNTTLSISQRKKIISERKRSIEKLKDQIKTIQGKSGNTKKIIDLLDKIKSTLTDLDKFLKQLSNADKKGRYAKKRLLKFLKKQATLGERRQKVEKHIEIVDKQYRLAEKFEEVSRLKIESKTLKQELKILPKLGKQVNALKEKIDKLKNKKNKLEGDIRALDPKIKSLERELEIATEWYNKLNTFQKRANVSYEMVKEIRLASEAARLSLHEIFTNYSDIINTNLTLIWPRLYSRQDIKSIQLNVEIKEIEEDEEKMLVPEVQLMRVGMNGEKIPFNTISSHGQRVLASIAFRIAFLNLLWMSSVPRILVLDEPTIWIDNKNKELLGQLLGSLVKEIKEGSIKINQLIVISHDSVFLNTIHPEGIKHICVKNREGFCEITTHEE